MWSPVVVVGKAIRIKVNHQQQRGFEKGKKQTGRGGVEERGKEQQRTKPREIVKPLDWLCMAIGCET